MASFNKTFNNQYGNVSSETKSNNEVNGVAAVAGMKNNKNTVSIEINNQNRISEVNSVPNSIYLSNNQSGTSDINTQNRISEVNSVPNQPDVQPQNRNTRREVNIIPNKPMSINNIVSQKKISDEISASTQINLHTKNIFSQVLLYFELCLNKILFIIKNNYNNEKSLLDNIINIESNFVEKINNNYKLQQDTITYVDQHQPSVFSLKEKLKIILCAFMHLAPNKICLIKNFNTQTMYHENKEVKKLLDNSKDPSIADLIISLGDLVYYAVQECKKTFGINEDKMKICSKLNNEMIYPITKYNVHEKFIILVSNYDTISMYKLLIIYVMHNNFPESS